MSIKVTLVINLELDDLSLADRQEAAKLMKCPLSEIPLVSIDPDHVEIGTLREGIERMLEDRTVINEWVWAGSDTFAQITDVEVKIAT